MSDAPKPEQGQTPATRCSNTCAHNRGQKHDDEHDDDDGTYILSTPTSSSCLSRTLLMLCHRYAAGALGGALDDLKRTCELLGGNVMYEYGEEPKANCIKQSGCGKIDQYGASSDCGSTPGAVIGTVLLGGRSQGPDLFNPGAPPHQLRRNPRDETPKTADEGPDLFGLCARTHQHHPFSVFD